MTAFGCTSAHIGSRGTLPRRRSATIRVTSRPSSGVSTVELILVGPSRASPNELMLELLFVRSMIGRPHSLGECCTIDSRLKSESQKPNGTYAILRCSPSWQACVTFRVSVASFALFSLRFVCVVSLALALARSLLFSLFEFT